MGITFGPGNKDSEEINDGPAWLPSSAVPQLIVAVQLGMELEHNFLNRRSNAPDDQPSALQPAFILVAVTLGPQPDVIVGVIVQLQYRLIYIHRHFFSS